VLACDPALRQRLISVAQELAAPDLLIRGADVWNAFTGEVRNADIAICGDRIARVGPWSGPLPDGTAVLDAGGQVAVPGYIEPHTHPWPFSNPLSLAEAALCRGTTCLVYDNSLLYQAMGAARMEKAARALSAAALPLVFWVARIASQSRTPDEEQLFCREDVHRLLEDPVFLGTAEMTRWSDLLDPARSARLLGLFEDARRMGKFNDGHLAGARERKLTALASAGIRCCHEAIDANEALERLRQGIWVIFRNSSLREDLKALLPSLSASAFHDRFAYTTDGTGESFIEDNGYLDHLIRIALQSGVPANLAYRMATLNAATLLRLEEDIGAIAPGRIADVNLLRALDDPTPRAVVCRGRLVAKDGTLVVSAPSEEFPWARWYAGSEPAIPQWDPEVFLFPRNAPNPFPAGRFSNAVITRECAVAMEACGQGLWPAGNDSIAVAATDRGGHWITRGVVQNLAGELSALASTHTTSAGILVLGRTAPAMNEALARLRRLGGGIVVSSTHGKWYEFPLPMGGVHTSGGFAQGAQAAREFRRAFTECGFPHSDPKHTLLFLTGDLLPEVRATQAGWVRVKTGEVLFPSEPLHDRLVGDPAWTR